MSSFVRRMQPDETRRTGHSLWRGRRRGGLHLVPWRATVHSKQEWPDWYPPAEVHGSRKPELRHAHGAVAKRHPARRG